MSRFSKAEAEERGWVFVHESEERSEIVGGKVRTTPPSLRAEKPLPGGGMINEEAETIGLLLERIAAYEAHLEEKGIALVPTVVDTTETHREISLDPEVGEGENPIVVSEEAAGTVILPGGERITEEELAARSRTDSIFDGEQMIHLNQPEKTAELEAVRAEAKLDAENERAAGEDVPTELVILTPSQDSVDGGQSDSTLLLRKVEQDSVEEEAPEVSDETQGVHPAEETPEA